MNDDINVILVWAFIFMAGSMIGWVLEVFYRRFISDTNPERKWINPGFLMGPYLAAGSLPDGQNSAGFC